MVVIPLVALSAGTISAARTAVRATAAAVTRHAPSAAPVVATPPSALQVEAASLARAAPAYFTTPLAVAAPGPAAAPSATARANVTAAAPRVAVTPPVVATPVRAVVRSTAPAPPHPSTPAPASAPAPVVAVTAGGHAEQGLASWYNAPHGTCAHPSLPFGTVLTITAVASGRTVTCRVDDRGPYAGGRVVDLSPDVFAQLAPLGAGVTVVRITW